MRQAVTIGFALRRIFPPAVAAAYIVAQELRALGFGNFSAAAASLGQPDGDFLRGGNSSTSF
jgi:glycerol uptake facilitator-like aquaporin